jgi:hypothetical protein
VSAVELGWFNPVQADLLIGKLRAEGIAAFPLPSSDEGGRGPTGVLVDQSDLAASRAIVLGDEKL